MDLGNMEDQDIRVKHLEQSLHKAETRAHEASGTAALLREQLERAQHDKRMLAAQHERAASTERTLRLEIAENNTSRDADRRKLREFEAKLMAAESEARISMLKIDTLTSTLASAEAEAKWYGGELDRRSTYSRDQARQYTTKATELETLLDQSRAERESLKRRVNAVQEAYETSQEKLERTQQKVRTLEKELEAKDSNLVSGGGSIRLERGIATLQAQVEASQMQEAYLQSRFTDISRAYNDACDRIEEQTKELQTIKEANLDLSKKLSNLENENTHNKNASGRLARQIQYLLINMQLASDSQPLLTPDEKLELSEILAVPISTNSTMEVVSERLAFFVDVAELLDQNEKQLRVLEALTAKCDKYEAQETVESEAVAEAKEAITGLTTLVKDLQKERDVLRSQLNGPKESASVDPSAIEDRISILQTDLDLAKDTASRLESQLSSVVETSANATQRAALLSQDLAETREVAEQLRVEKARLETQYKFIQSQFETQQIEIRELASQRNAINADYNDLRDSLTSKDRNFEATQKALVDQINSIRAEVTGVRHELSESEAQVKLYASQRDLAYKTAETHKTELLQAQMAKDALQSQYNALEKDLKSTEERLRLRTLSFTTADSDKASKLEEQLTQAEAQIQDLRTLSSDTQKEMDAKQEAFHTQKSDLEKQISELQESLDKTSNELEMLKNTPPDTTKLDAAKLEITTMKTELEKVTTDAAAAAKKSELQLQSAAASHATAISDLESKYETCKAKITDLELQFETLSRDSASEKLRYESEIASLNKQRETLDASVTTLRNENSELSASKELLLQQLQATVKIETEDHDGTAMDTSTLEDKDPIIEMLKRDKQTANVLLQVSENKARDLENQTKVLQEALSKAEVELSNIQSTTNSAPDLTSLLQESNTDLVTQLKECTTQRDQLLKDLEASREALKPLEEGLRAAQATAATAEEELNLVKADRDLWKSRIGSTDDEKLSSLQTQLAEKEAQLETLKQESAAKLEQEAQKGRLATSQVMQLNSRIQELTKGSETKLAEEIAKKDSRISFLENEINRISDELTEEEVKKKKLSDEAIATKSKVDELESALKVAQESVAAATVAQASAAANAEAEERIKKLEAELATANANAATFTQLGSNLDSTTDTEGNGDSEELEKLVQELSSKSSAEEVNKFRELVATVTKDRIKGKTASIMQERVKAINDEKDTLIGERDALKTQVAELKADAAKVEETVAKRMELKLKILQNKADKTQQNNEELKLTIRKLKGGDNSVNVVTLPDGTTKAVPSGASTPQEGNPAQAKQQQRLQNQKRPQVQRNGSKQQNKRNNQNEDHDLNKRLRES